MQRGHGKIKIVTNSWLSQTITGLHKP